MMHLKPVHHGLGLALLSILVALRCLPSQGPTVTSSLTEASEVNSSPGEAASVNPDSVDETTAAPEHAIDSPEADGLASESAPQPDSLQTNASIVSIAQSEISDDEWQVVESELALFYAQKNSSAQSPISPENSFQAALNQSD